nr:nitrile-specifier protein 5 [Quercus suber]
MGWKISERVLDLDGRGSREPTECNQWKTTYRSALMQSPYDPLPTVSINGTRLYAETSSTRPPPTYVSGGWDTNSSSSRQLAAFGLPVIDTLSSGQGHHASSWTKIAQDGQLQRSSHCVAVVGSALYIIGGELQPRQPRDNDVHKVELGLKATSTLTTIASTPSSPSPRVGAALTSLAGKLYMFSGRGGEAMSAVDEQGSLWIFDPAASDSNAWTLQAPSTPDFPEARSYHCLTNDGADAIYLHAGCPASGRLADFWRFRVSTSTWEQLSPAPGAPRGGMSIAYAGRKVYRMNGFDGKQEVGGSVDVYDVASDGWTSVAFAADGVEGPGPRSVAALLALHHSAGGGSSGGEDDVSLVTLFGESDPSALGHMGAGKMLPDVWQFAVAEGKWRPVRTPGAVPQARGWFDAAVVRIEGRDCVVVAGGLGEANERLDDVWVLPF